MQNDWEVVTHNSQPDPVYNPRRSAHDEEGPDSGGVGRTRRGRCARLPAHRPRRGARRRGLSRVRSLPDRRRGDLRRRPAHRHDPVRVSVDPDHGQRVRGTSRGESAEGRRADQLVRAGHGPGLQRAGCGGGQDGSPLRLGAGRSSLRHRAGGVPPRAGLVDVRRVRARPASGADPAAELGRRVRRARRVPDGERVRLPRRAVHRAGPDGAAGVRGEVAERAARRWTPLHLRARCGRSLLPHRRLHGPAPEERRVDGVGEERARDRARGAGVLVSEGRVRSAAHPHRGDRRPGREAPPGRTSPRRSPRWESSRAPCTSRSRRARGPSRSSRWA